MSGGFRIITGKNGAVVGVVSDVKISPPRKSVSLKMYEIKKRYAIPVEGVQKGSVSVKNVQYGPSLLTEVIRYLLIEDILNQANVRMFVDRFGARLSEEERKEIMEKYGVQIDKNKTEKKDGEKTAGANDPNVNVPKDPDAGTEPYEKEPEGGR